MLIHVYSIEPVLATSVSVAACQDNGSNGGPQATAGVGCSSGALSPFVQFKVSSPFLEPCLTLFFSPFPTPFLSCLGPGLVYCLLDRSASYSGGFRLISRLPSKNADMVWQAWAIHNAYDDPSTRIAVTVGRSVWYILLFFPPT